MWSGEWGVGVGCGHKRRRCAAACGGARRLQLPACWGMRECGAGRHAALRIPAQAAAVRHTPCRYGATTYWILFAIVFAETGAPLGVILCCCGREPGGGLHALQPPLRRHQQERDPGAMLHTCALPQAWW